MWSSGRACDGHRRQREQDLPPGPRTDRIRSPHADGTVPECSRRRRTEGSEGDPRGCVFQAVCFGSACVMNAHRQRIYDYLTGDTHIKLSRRERAKCRRMQERRINRKRVHFQRMYVTRPILRSDGKHEYTPDAPAYYGERYRRPQVRKYWDIGDTFALNA
ncbi:hypothetical protein 20Sep420_00060 [Pseudomonas phage 20Sep420]|nr:hypothetical protein 20Sep420_00060 [Pseudomonas phage 20Sep420]